MVLLAVFVPTAMMGGITGRLYQQFALTIATATVFSSINALTLSPALVRDAAAPRRPRSGGVPVHRVQPSLRRLDRRLHGRSSRLGGSAHGGHDVVWLGIFVGLMV